MLNKQADQIVFRCSRVLKELMQNRAKEEKINLSDLIRKSCVEYLNNTSRNRFQNTH
jgi:hypothetical protein